MIKIKAILGIALVILGAIAAFFFFKYNGTAIPYPIGFMALSIVIAFAGGALFNSAVKTEDKEITDAYVDDQQDLKANSYKITVDLNKCEVTSHTYNKERDTYDGPRNHAIPNSPGSISPSEHLLSRTRTDMTTVTDIIEVSQSIFTYETEVSGVMHKYTSPVLGHDRETLMFKLFLQKTTSLYVDRRDPERYYFDLDFLDA